MSDERKDQQQDQQARQGPPTQRAQQQGQGRENQSGPFTTPGPSERPQGGDQRQVNPEQRAQEQRDQQAQAQNPAQPAQPAGTAVHHPVPSPTQAIQAQTDRAFESVELARSYPGKPLGVPMGAEAQQVDAGQQQQEREQQLREKEGDDPAARLKRHLATAYNFPDNLRQAFSEWIDRFGVGSPGPKPQQQQPSHEQRDRSDVADLRHRVEILARAVADMHAALSSDSVPASVRRAVAEVEPPRPQEDAKGSGSGKK